MDKKKNDPYYRDFPFTLLPARTPFTREGRSDAGHVFLYLTNRHKRWSLLLEKAQTEKIYEEARQRLLPGFVQGWFLEKRYSTRRSTSRLRVELGRKTSCAAPPAAADEGDNAWPGQTLVVLKEPALYSHSQGDVLSYHLHEAEAIDAAEAYTRLHKRRTVVGLLLWDVYWI